MICADTGFIASLHLEESTTADAVALAQSTTEPIAVTAWGLLELRNAFHRAVFTRRIDDQHRDVLWSRVESGLDAGQLQEQTVDADLLLGKARELTDKHTPTVGTRTLDLLHVAAALLLDASEFWSFDERQRKVAEAEGLTVKP